MTTPEATTPTAPQPRPEDSQAEHPTDKTPQLDTTLHLRIAAEGSAKASTLESATAALAEIRKQRARLIQS